MTTTIFDILALYGFETRSTDVVWWGIGSLVWGHTANVQSLGNDLYEVVYHEWFYDCSGECVLDERTTSVLHGALLLQYLFERLPL